MTWASVAHWLGWFWADLTRRLPVMGIGFDLAGSVRSCDKRASTTSRVVGSGWMTCEKAEEVSRRNGSEWVAGEGDRAAGWRLRWEERLL